MEGSDAIPADISRNTVVQSRLNQFKEMKAESLIFIIHLEQELIRESGVYHHDIVLHSP